MKKLYLKARFQTNASFEELEEVMRDKVQRYSPINRVKSEFKGVFSKKYIKLHNRQQVKDAGRSLSYPVLRAKVEEFDMGTEFDICIVPSVSTLLSSGVFLVFGISVFSSFLFWKLFFWQLLIGTALLSVFDYYLITVRFNSQANKLLSLFEDSLSSGRRHSK